MEGTIFPTAIMSLPLIQEEQFSVSDETFARAMINDLEDLYSLPRTSKVTGST